MSTTKGSIFILFGDVVLTIDMPDERLSRFNAIGVSILEFLVENNVSQDELKLMLKLGE